MPTNVPVVVNWHAVDRAVISVNAYQNRNWHSVVRTVGYFRSTLNRGSCILVHKSVEFKISSDLQSFNSLANFSEPFHDDRPGLKIAL